MDKVMLGLSGGVDSSVCCALLKRMGYEVYALYLDIGRPGELEAARETARALDVPFLSADISRELQELVIAPFCSAYAAGRTPNPCVICNPNVKFASLCVYADRVGARYISTGHYARVDRENGVTRILRAKSRNDQSYMLCGLRRAQLERLILPLGGLEKKEVREIARKLGLEAARKPDSMEICFVPDGDYAGFIESRGVRPPEGNFVSPEGAVLGKHRGIHRYTLGQRRGLGIALGERMFVSDIRPETNEVILSRGGELLVSDFFAHGANWLTEGTGADFECTVRVRHSKDEVPAVVEITGGELFVRLKVPLRAPAPGQAAAFYDGDILLGGAVIGKQN